LELDREAADNKLFSAKLQFGVTPFPYKYLCPWMYNDSPGETAGSGAGVFGRAGATFSAFSTGAGFSAADSVLSAAAVAAGLVSSGVSVFAAAGGVESVGPVGVEVAGSAGLLASGAGVSAGAGVPGAGVAGAVEVSAGVTGGAEVSAGAGAGVAGAAGVADV